MTFEEAMDGIMDTLADAGFCDIAGAVDTKAGELTLFVCHEAEAERLLRIIQRGLADYPLPRR
jgi:hypothetical protein